MILYCFSRIVYDLYHQPFPVDVDITKESVTRLLVQCIAFNTSLSVTISKGVVLYRI